MKKERYKGYREYNRNYYREYRRKNPRYREYQREYRARERIEEGYRWCDNCNRFYKPAKQGEEKNKGKSYRSILPLEVGKKGKPNISSARLDRG